MNDWHLKGTQHYYADPDERVLGWVRPGMGTFYAETTTAMLGEYLSPEAAKKRVEKFFASPFTPQPMLLDPA